ncbi:MAG TPA: 2-C-methyl-D-erythritol 2,4-cyclodiphosphate synthase [Candidatus Limnocylindrales bacterium]|nr:2-C-methyl-D-erythritol 2,4-cyclodiphosphate synthase [Candidatus Limnocylindrales bacterium]
MSEGGATDLPTPIADVVIVAAGAATRMGGIDKITAPIDGRPLLAWTLEAFTSLHLIDRIVVVVPRDRVADLRAAPWMPSRAIVVAGGARRQESVAAGVAEIERSGAPDDRIVLVHDGARPAIRAVSIMRVVRATATHGAAIPIVPAVDTLKRVDGDVVAGTVDRTGLGFAQTPQGVRLGILRAAWARFPPTAARTFTDEAALLEACTIPVHVVPGQSDNLKVTLPIDRARAASILGADRPRVGFGDDAHPFGPGEPLALGGLAIVGAPRLAGHSDGDVVLHAVADALLGAAGLGDLGRMFPADDRTPRGVDSSELLGEVTRRVRDAGFDIGHVDITVVAARPRLGDRLDAMRERIAELLLVPGDRVNVKASTGNLVGMEGAGRGIAARAVATLERTR